MSNMTGCEHCGVGPECECTMDCPRRRPDFQRELDEAIEAGDRWGALTRHHQSAVEEISRDLVVPTLGVMRIAQERHRQIKAEGWTPEHDDDHTDEQLRWAAACYLLTGRFTIAEEDFGDRCWPWVDGWKPGMRDDDPVRNLVKAGALIAAEIDRLERARAQSS